MFESEFAEMFMLDSDYIQLESRRAAELAAQQWQTVTRLSKKELVRAHQLFVCKIYVIGLLCTALVAAQWWFLTKMFKAVQTFLIFYYYVILVIIFVNFLIMSFSQYILRQQQNRPRIIAVVYLVLMVELGSVILSRPTIEADLRTFTFASIFSFLMWSISFGLSAIGITTSHRSPANLSLWSQKYYLITAISLLMTIQFSFIYIQISITLIMAFFLSIFFVLWGLSLGSLKFYKEESKYCNYYIILTYLNTISFFANSIVFIQRIIDIN